MKDTFEFTLNNPLTEEQWDMITDVDFDRTDRITFHTKHGKEVEFAKVIRCKDCIHHHGYICDRLYGLQDAFTLQDDDFCSKAEPKEADG
jgi:hypothetical protein